MNRFLLVLMLLLSFTVTFSAWSAEQPQGPAAQVQTTASPAILSSDEVRHSLRLYPFYLFEGGMRGDFMTRIGQSSWAIGPTFETFNYDLFLVKQRGWGAGVTSLYSFNGNPMKHTWYLAPEVKYQEGRVGINYILGDSEGDYRAIEGALTAGYQWMWKGLGLSLGAGISYAYVEVRNSVGHFNLFGASGDAPPDSGIGAASAFGLTLDFLFSIPL